MLQFKIEQIALAPAHGASDKAAALLRAMGLDAWITDRVHAQGQVFGKPAMNVAHLSFNYQAEPESQLELEMLCYESGRHWLPGEEPLVSHLGMHCNAEELEQWRALFREHGVEVVQEVDTTSHENEFLRNSGRKYHYCIFGTRGLIGTDLKFIVRR
jgi:hypothetical protein